MPQIDNPESVAASIPGRLKAVEDRLKQFSAVPLGKVVFDFVPVAPLTPTLTSSPTFLIATVVVPPFASSCGYTVSASGIGVNPGPSSGTLTVGVTVACGAYSRSRTASQPAAPGPIQVAPSLVDTFPVTPGATITFTASASVDLGTWNDPTNQLALTPALLFAY